MRRVLTIGYQARSPKTRAGLVESYRKLMATTRATVRDAATMVRRIGQRAPKASPAVRQSLRKAQDQLRALRPVVQRVLAQTRAWILRGDTHVPDKVLSIFEPHTETIRKGKIATPNEFGRLVTIQESEHQSSTTGSGMRGRWRAWRCINVAASGNSRSRARVTRERYVRQP